MDEEDLKISLPEELAKKIEEYHEINWAIIARNAIKKYIKELESQIIKSSIK